MDCPAIRVTSAPYDGEAPYHQVLKETAGKLKEVEQISKRIGVRALLEIHAGTIIPSASAAYRLVSQFDPRCVGLILDPANMVIEGREHWKMGLEILGEYLAHVHVKNVGWFSREYQGETRWKWEYAPLAKGMVDWQEVMTALNAVGYNGYLSIEDLYGGILSTSGLVGENLPIQKSPTIPTRQKLTEDLEYLRSIVGAL